MGSTTATQAEHHELTTEVSNWVCKLRDGMDEGVMEKNKARDVGSKGEGYIKI